MENEDEMKIRKKTPFCCAVFQSSLIAASHNPNSEFNFFFRLTDHSGID